MLRGKQSAQQQRQQSLVSGSTNIPFVVIVLGIVTEQRLLTEGSTSTTHTTQTSLTRLPALSDALFTEDVVMDVAARSRVECSKQCVQTQGCVMCTFHHSAQASPGGSGGECRMFGRLHVLADDHLQASGAKSYGLAGATREPRCDADYVLVCGRCVKSVAVKTNYTAARDHCSQDADQGHLVVLTTVEDMDCIGPFVQENSLSGAWVGADDLATPGQFQWNDGSSLQDDSPVWRVSAGEPHKSNTVNCVRLQSTLRLYDGPCDSLRKYICQTGPE
ncbi:uncharacterized protein LOC143289613 [Babylonia areolata]|uniref:uncharacterized protein LOC143289613 n=1 Tax=Babylonia areolata TaxID=304850 RepID=UPI003FD0F4B3